MFRAVVTVAVGWVTVAQRENLAAVEIEVRRKVIADVAGGSTEVLVVVVILITSAIKVGTVAVKSDIGSGLTEVVGRFEFKTK